VLLYFRLPEQLAKKPTIDELSAKLEVLQAEHDSLQDFLKKSSEKEAREKKEREEKHAQDIAELSDKLKKSNGQIKTLVVKAKTFETEAEDIDKLIFRRNFLLFPASSC
jgi:predicted nuclease with TOPRIM domain